MTLRSYRTAVWIMLALVALLAVPQAAGAATYERLPANTPAKPSFSPFADYTGAYSLRAHWAWLQGRSDGSSVSAAGGSTRCNGTTNTVQALIYQNEWANPMTQPRQVTRCDSGGRMVIAVIDDGVNTSLPVFPNTVQGADCRQIDTAGYDNVDTDGANGAYEYDCGVFAGAGTVTPTTDPGNFHGTEVASAALGNGAAAGTAQTGFYGSAPGAAVMPIQKGGAGDYERAIGLRWAVDHGADVVNLSWSYNGATTTTATDHPLLSQALAYAVSNGVPVFCSSGNGDGPVAYPANDPNCIAIGSLTRNASGDWTAASVYSRGSELDFMATGDNTYIVKLDGTVTPDTGTSFSSPAVAGAAAVLLANGTARPTGADATIESSALYAALRSSARDLGTAGRDASYGWGLPDLGAAFGLGMPTVTVADPPVITDPGGGTGGTGGTGTPTLTRCTGATLSVPLRGRVSFASRACTLSFTISIQPAAGSVSGSTYIAPTSRLGTFVVEIRSADGAKVQTLTFVVTKQRPSLVKPAFICKQYKVGGRVVAGKSSCTVTAVVPALAGGGRAAAQIQRKVKVGAKFVWKAAGSCSLAATGKAAGCSKVLGKGSYRVRVSTGATTLRDAAVSVFALRTV